VTKLAEKVDAAEAAILSRLMELGENENPDGSEGRQALKEASSRLRAIQIEKLKYPRWDAE
jgi:hypothetical protein